jgi:dienelactone hydrolase
MNHAPYARAALVALLMMACSSATSKGDVDAGAQPDQSAPHVEGGHVDAPSVHDGSTDVRLDHAVTIDAFKNDSGGTPDPNEPGPYAYKEIDDSTDVAASGDQNLAIHCAYPTSGPTAGPYPVVVVAHGLSLAASEYYGYLQRLASFGYVALTVDYPASVFSVNNPAEAQDLLGGLDWAAASPVVKSLADTSSGGMTGHSLGGKVALLAATLDARVKAAIVLDPVDGGGGQACTAPECVTVASLLPSLQVPTGFLGETTDATGGVGGMPCAPAADNYATFYAQANAPSLEVTVVGADHTSFLDDVSTCGFFCSLCTAGTAPNAQVNGLAEAYVAAFYERYLRGNTAYDTYLTGAKANARYVVTNEAVITSK